MKFFNVILFFCNVAVLIIIIGLNDKLETHNKILLSPDLQNQIKEICHDAAKKTMAVTEKELFTRGINTDKQLAAIKTQVEAIEKGQSKDIASLANRLEKIESLQLQSIAEAAKSFELAQKLKSQGKIVEAKTYALNAINHQKKNFDYLKFYTDIVIYNPHVTVNELNQLLAILDTSLFNVSAENISGIIALRNGVIQKQNLLNAKTAASSINLNEELETVTNGKYAMANIVKGDNVDMELLKLRIEKINALLGENLTDNKRNYLTQELEIASNIYSAQLTFKSVRNSLNKASAAAKNTTLSKSQILAARNQLSTATTLLAQIWTMELPDNTVRQAINIQKDIACIDEKLNIIASKDAIICYEKLVIKLEKIKHTISNTSTGNYANRKGTLTQYLKDIQKIVDELQKLEIYDKVGQKKVIATIKESQELATGISSKRYQAYQLWALDKIKKAFNERYSVGVKAYRDKKAIKDFQDLLMDIDRSLLTFDVGTCYDNIHNEIFHEQVPDKEKADLQFSKATFEKIGKLEDF